MADWYVATDGTAGGDGSIGDPWDIDTAFAHPGSVQPGDTIYLRGGIYSTGDITSTLTGTASQRITVRSYSGEWAKIDLYDGTPGGLFLDLGIAGAYTDFRNLEVLNSNPQTRVSPNAGDAGDITRGTINFLTGTGSRIINCVIHDMRQGIGFWKEAVGGELYGNIIYNNGWLGTDRGHGHGVYTTNFSSATKLYRENITFNQFGLGIQAYPTPLESMHFIGNVMFQNGYAQGDTPHAKIDCLIGGTTTQAFDIVVNSNYSYGHEALSTVYFGYLFGGSNLDITWNTNYLYSGFNEWPKPWASITGSGNIVDNITGANQPSTGFTEISRASQSGTKIDVRPNAYEAGRGHVVIYNWDDANSVPVNISSVIGVGEEFEIYHVYDLATPVLTGTYGGGTVNVPMAITAPPTLLGDTSSLGTPINLPKEFAAFLLLKTAEADPQVNPQHTYFNRCGRGGSWAFDGPSQVGGY